MIKAFKLGASSSHGVTLGCKTNNCRPERLKIEKVEKLKRKKGKKEKLTF
jgi:hypothetical protein